MQSDFMLVTIALIVGVGMALMILERLFPARALPGVKSWWSRVILINVLQAGMVVLGGLTWEHWLQRYSLIQLTETVGVAGSGVVAYLVVTFAYYWWHRVRHESQFLWNSLHQLHHSAQRIETITSFYKHPLEIFTNSIIISLIIYCGLGLTLHAGAWVTVLTCYAEFFYHMNIKTPHWVGYIIQRPESHRVHHEMGKHYRNFSDLPVWDMLFGTFYNPKSEIVACGFKPEREARFWDMLRFKDVNLPRRAKR
jgi:sterol desaturase/sphingolipid hydroxylase (fatty acid hydroxylase superfamily)